MELNGKIALVTGGAKRIGREIALGLARKGVDILLHYRTSEDAAEETAAAIRAAGAGCDLFRADLSKPADILSLTESIYKKKKAVHILVNSASLFYKTPFDTVTEADWDKLTAANLKGPFLLSKEIGNKMFAQGAGKIVNIADWSGLRPYKDYAPYCVSKGGLVTLTKTLARDLAPRVMANAVAPGPVLAPPDMSEAEKEAIARTTALGRWGAPQDIANAVIFLLDNDFINGTVLVVDGGRSII